MPLVGNLRDFALHDFLYLVDRGYKTGSLLLTGSERGAVLYFDKGKLLSVSRPEQHERLGQLLVRIGKISQAQCDEAVAAQENGNIRPLGQILVEQGHITPADLQRCVQQQLEEMVYELFNWREGEFKFEAGKKPSLDEVQSPTPLAVENLIMEGVRRVDEGTRIRERIPNNDVVVVLPPNAAATPPSVNLTANEWRVFARINGQTSINDIAQKTGLSPFEVGHVVYGLITTGLAEVRKPAPAAPLAANDLPRVRSSSQRTTSSSAQTQPLAAATLKRGLVGRLIERIRGI